MIKRGNGDGGGGGGKSGRGEEGKKEVKDPDYENATLSNEIRGEVNFEKFD